MSEYFSPIEIVSWLQKIRADNQHCDSQHFRQIVDIGAPREWMSSKKKFYAGVEKIISNFCRDIDRVRNWNSNFKKFK